MRSQSSIIGLSVGAGIFAWVLDALIDTVLLDGGEFKDVLILKVPPQELYGRIAALAIFFGLGMILASLLAEREEVEEEPVVEQAPAEPFADEADVMMLGLDRDGRIIFFNQRCEEITGHRREEVLGQVFFDMVIPVRALPRALTAFKSVVERGEHVDAEMPWLTAPGHEVIISSHISPVHDDRGEVTGVVAIGQEVTEFRLSETELIESRQPYRGLAETMMGDGMAAIDRDGTLTWVSLSLAEMLGRDRDELVGSNVLRLARAEDRGILEQRLEECINGGQRVNFELTITTESGHRFPAAFAMMALDQPDDDTIGSFAVIRDLRDIKGRETPVIDEREELEAELTRLSERLQEAESRIESAREEARAEFQADLERMSAKVEDADRRVAEAREQALAEQQATIDNLQHQLEAAEARVEQARGAAGPEQQERIEELQAQLAEAEERAEQARQATLAEQQ
ncbi:MAG: PAS domain S-box protein, partial [Armatimonadota bacterium]|nr:PAS domain S-box protein [Armatimonadota bacterium]